MTGQAYTCFPVQVYEMMAKHTPASPCKGRQIPNQTIGKAYPTRRYTPKSGYTPTDGGAEYVAKQKRYSIPLEPPMVAVKKGAYSSKRTRIRPSVVPTLVLNVTHACDFIFLEVVNHVSDLRANTRRANTVPLDDARLELRQGYFIFDTRIVLRVPKVPETLRPAVVSR